MIPARTALPALWMPTQPGKAVWREFRRSASHPIIERLIWQFPFAGKRARMAGLDRRCELNADTWNATCDEAGGTLPSARPNYRDGTSTAQRKRAAGIGARAFAGPHEVGGPSERLN